MITRVLLVTDRRVHGVQDLAGALDEDLARHGELVGWDGRVVERTSERGIGLVTRQGDATRDGDAVEAELSVNISVLQVEETKETEREERAQREGLLVAEFNFELCVWRVRPADIM